MQSCGLRSAKGGNPFGNPKIANGKKAQDAG